MIDINDSKSMADCWYVNIMAIRIHFLEIVLNFMKSHTHGLWSGQHCYLFIVFLFFSVYCRYRESKGSVAHSKTYSWSLNNWRIKPNNKIYRSIGTLIWAPLCLMYSFIKIFIFFVSGHRTYTRNDDPELSY